MNRQISSSTERPTVVRPRKFLSIQTGTDSSKLLRRVPGEAQRLHLGTQQVHNALGDAARSALWLLASQLQYFAVTQIVTRKLVSAASIVKIILMLRLLRGERGIAVEDGEVRDMSSFLRAPT